MTTVKCSEFVKRQTAESGYSHYDGTWEELEEMVATSMAKPQCVRPGYKDGVILVDLTTGYEYRKFYSAIVKLDRETKLDAAYAHRREEEDPYIRVGAKAAKQLAKYVTFVCYRADVLSEDDDRSTDADWEIIAIKARLTKEEEPMDPYTMARNFLHLKGGTKGDFTAEQFAKSILFWNNHSMCLGKRSLLGRIKNWLSLPKKD